MVGVPLAGEVCLEDSFQALYVVVQSEKIFLGLVSFFSQEKEINMAECLISPARYYVL